MLEGTVPQVCLFFNKVCQFCIINKYGSNTLHLCLKLFEEREREIFWTSPHTHTLIDCSLYLYFSKLLREVALEYCNNSNQIQEGRKIFNYTHTHTHIDRQIHRHENKLLYWLLSTSSRNSLEHISSTDKCSIQ